MYIEKLKLNNYRNYEYLDIKFHKNVNIILGNNAQGKTNLIEAIYLSSMGKSFRTSKDKEIIKFNENYSKVNIEFSKFDESSNMDIILASDGRKSIKIDSVQIKKMSEIMDNIITVIFSPEDLEIIKSDPSVRRNFIDREISQLKPIYFNYLRDYKKVIQNKNKYLKNEKIDIKIIDVFNEQIAEYGSKILIYRSDFIKKLNEISKTIHSGITDGKESFFVSYDSGIIINDIEINFENLEKIRNEYLRILNICRSEDIYRKICTRGIHRDDLKVYINDIDVKKFGSQGQKRTASLSLKLAEIKLIQKEKKENPILLLDDVMSELDYDRQKYLINSIKDIQIFLTTTELTKDVLMDLPKGYIIKIKDGSVLEIIK